MKVLNLLFAFIGPASVVFSAPTVEPGVLKKRVDNQAYCSWNSNDNTTANFRIITYGSWTAVDYGTALRYYLENQCGEDTFEFWEFYYGTDGAGYASFSLSYGWPENCVENSISLASVPSGEITGVECTYAE